jgi:hypothetical protein
VQRCLACTNKGEHVQSLHATTGLHIIVGTSLDWTNAPCIIMKRMIDIDSFIGSLRAKTRC